MAGKDAWEGTGVYSASKFGIQGLSRALSDEERALLEEYKRENERSDVPAKAG